MKQQLANTFLAICAVIAFVIFVQFGQDETEEVTYEAVTPNWAAISAWPMLEVDAVQALPDPNRRVTAIVLDDSGSMSKDIIPAKDAVIGTLDAMADDDRVAVYGLNARTILAFTSVAEARQMLPGLLAPIGGGGSTPLARSIRDAQALLEAEAAGVRGFGTFRLIVTTDGQADEPRQLDAVIETLASSTPIQLTTIGIGIQGGHVLRRNDLGTFVEVDNVAALENALQAAVAENTDFTAITDFGDTEG